MSQTFTISNRNIASQFTMHQAKVEHTSDILALLVESAKWLQSKGSTQWNALLDGVDSHNTEVAIQRGDVFICKDGEEIAWLCCSHNRVSGIVNCGGQKQIATMELSIYIV